MQHDIHKAWQGCHECAVTLSLRRKLLRVRSAKIMENVFLQFSNARREILGIVGLVPFFLGKEVQSIYCHSMDLAGRTELHRACREGDSAAVAALLASGHDPLRTSRHVFDLIYFLFTFYLKSTNALFINEGMITYSVIYSLLFILF